MEQGIKMIARVINEEKEVIGYYVEAPDEAKDEIKHRIYVDDWHKTSDGSKLYLQACYEIDPNTLRIFEENTKIEQGIKLLEDMGYVKQTEYSSQLVFRKINQSYDSKWIYIDKKNGVTKEFADDTAEWLTLEEIKACTMILEAMKGKVRWKN